MLYLYVCILILVKIPHFRNVIGLNMLKTSSSRGGWNIPWTSLYKSSYFEYTIGSLSAAIMEVEHGDVGDKRDIFQPKHKSNIKLEINMYRDLWKKILRSWKSPLSHKFNFTNFNDSFPSFRSFFFAISFKSLFLVSFPGIISIVQLHSRETTQKYLDGGFKYFYVHSYLGKWSNLTNMFQMGWNHQLDIDFDDTWLGNLRDTVNVVGGLSSNYSADCSGVFSHFFDPFLGRKSGLQHVAAFVSHGGSVLKNILM